MHTPLTLASARDAVREALVGSSGIGADLVGLEAETFVMSVVGDKPGSRAPLHGASGSVEVVDHARLGRPTEISGNPAFELGDLGTITFEPGAQIEHATRPRPSASEAIDDLRTVRRGMAMSAAEFERRLVSCGTDPWHLADDIPQFLPGPRYKAMADYFDTRGRCGPHMMRNTASLQINLDGGSNLPHRWRVANLLSPLLTATFSTSPSASAASDRAKIWQNLDPTRTGFPPDLSSPSALDALVEWCLDADVVFRWEDEVAIGFDPGVRLRDWICGLDGVRPAIAEDLSYHLTTLFPEVRLRRGVLELRAVDALPASMVAAPVVLTVGAIYDEQAAHEIAELLDSWSDRLPRIWLLAARSGLADARLHELACGVWAAALAGAARLGSIREAHLAEASVYVTNHVLSGRTLTDHILDRPTSEHFALCSEPVPHGARSCC